MLERERQEHRRRPRRARAGRSRDDRRLDGVPPAAARRYRAARHRPDLRRGGHLPDRLRRRAGPPRSDARPDDDEQGDRRRAADGGVGAAPEIMDLLDPELHGGVAPVASVSTFGGNQASLAAGIACLEQLTPEVHARIQAIGDRARSGIDELGRRRTTSRFTRRVSATCSGCTGRRSRSSTTGRGCRSDREKIVNLHLALMNEGYYQMSLGYFLLSTEVGRDRDRRLPRRARRRPPYARVRRVSGRALEGRVAVVTGGGSGIGEAICVRLEHEEGGSVAVLDVDLEAAELTATLVGGVAVRGRRRRRGLRRRRARGGRGGARPRRHLGQQRRDRRRRERGADRRPRRAAARRGAEPAR